MSPPVRRRTPHHLALPAVVLGLCAALVAGCGGSSGGEPSTTTSPTSAAPVPTASGPIPTVEGDFGVKPTVTIPDEDPADALVTKTVITGTGAVVQSGDLLVVQYLGETWDDGNVFDSSFERGSPASFPIGVGQVIQGWDTALVGQTVGSRVVMAVPPSLGYGEAGNPDAEISGDDTLVFVVDILGTYPPGTGSAYASTSTNPILTGLPTVAGFPGAQPTVTVPAGTKPPTENTTVLLARGDGPEIEAGSYLILQYEAVTWNNNAVGSTWTAGSPLGVSVGLAATPTPFDKLIGSTVGSRLLLMVPAQPSGDPAVDSTAVVVDIIDAIPPAS